MAIETTKSVVEIWNRALHRIGSTIKVQNTDERTAEAEACRVHYGDWLISAFELVKWPFATKQVQLSAAVQEWVSTTAYAADDKVRYEGVVYKAVQATTGDNPESDDGTYWAYQYGLGVGWDYAYALPGDFVNFIAFVTSAGARIDRTPFDLVSDYVGAGSVMVTDLAPDDFSVMEYTGLPGGYDGDTGELVENPRLYTRLFVNAIVFGLASDLALSLKKDMNLADRMLKYFEHAIGLARASVRNNIVDLPEPETPSVSARQF